MYESSVIQHFTEQGERKGAIESLLDVLEVRFQSSEVQTLNPIIESIEEYRNSAELHHEAVQVSSLDEFRQYISIKWELNLVAGNYVRIIGYSTFHRTRY